MKKEVINGHHFEFYDAIDELPISQFHKYSKYILVDSGIGSDMASIDSHISDILQYIGRDDKKARAEVLNLRRNIYMVSNEAGTGYKAFLCLTYKVDGKVWTDFSEDGIDELYDMCIDAKLRELTDIFSTIKKRLDDELSTYFPQLFSDSVSKNINALMHKRALLQLDSIIEGKDHADDIERMTRNISHYMKPKNFEDGDENAEVKFDKDFESMCLAMSSEFGGIIKGYSVMEFYSAYETLERQSKAMEKSKSRRK